MKHPNVNIKYGERVTITTPAGTVTIAAEDNLLPAHTPTYGVVIKTQKQEGWLMVEGEERATLLHPKREP